MLLQHAELLVAENQAKIRELFERFGRIREGGLVVIYGPDGRPCVLEIPASCVEESTSLIRKTLLMLDGRFVVFASEIWTLDVEEPKTESDLAELERVRARGLVHQPARREAILFRAEGECYPLQQWLAYITRDSTGKGALEPWKAIKLMDLLPDGRWYFPSDNRPKAN